MNFDHSSIRLEGHRSSFAREVGHYAIHVQLIDSSALAAKKHGRRMRVVPMSTGHKCLQAGDAMYEAHLKQEVQRPINGRRHCFAGVADTCKQVVRSYGRICFKKGGQHFSA